MKTIIVNESDLDFEKYDGFSSPFMFDEFNLIVYTRTGTKLKFEVRTEKEGLIFRINKGLWLGMRSAKNISEIYPEPGKMTVNISENGNISIGIFLIPTSLMTKKEIEARLKYLSTEEGYKAELEICGWLASVLCVIMMMGKEEREKRIKRQPTTCETSEKPISYKDSDKQIYLLSDIISYIADNLDSKKKKHLIQCPCWEVRGHYRHYKTGKEVFVPAYRKGKQRNKAEPRDKKYYM